MKKSRVAFIVFLVFTVAIVAYGIYYALGNVNSETYEFLNDGYALYVADDGEFKTQSFSFSSGTKYSYKKTNDKITFNSNNGNVNIDESTLIHYTDNSIMSLKNVVGLDMTTIDKDIIFYYNIYKNTQITNSQDNYVINTNNNEKITFKNMLIRVNENKYLLLGSNIRVTLSSDEVIDFGKYVYFEYEDGSVVKIYNNNKSYRTVSANASVVCGENIIDLGDKTITKEKTKYITLTNLIIDNDSNIDIIPSTTISLPDINQSDVDTSGNAGSNAGSSGESSGGAGNIIDGNGSEMAPTEEEVDPSLKIKQPKFKVTEMIITPIKIDAKIEIEDADNIIVSPIDVSIVENSTAKKIYQATGQMGDISVEVSYAALKPDTEYTLYAKASYEIEGIEYEKSFVSKIFRTEALGVSFEKSYATADSLAIKLTRENYSEVSAVTMSIYNMNNERLNYRVVDFSDGDITEVIFAELDNNTEYRVVMHEIICQGIAVEGGYSERQNYKTLKNAPTIGELKYVVDKKNNSFSLKSEKITDNDYGIINYRYEIYDSRQNINTENPIAVINTKDSTNVNVNVDETKLFRGATYTYKLVLEFNDNEKIVEYSKALSGTMQLDGVEYPTIKFDENYVTWEQINGAIVVDDPSGAIVSERYKVVYYNSLGVYTSKEIMADADTGAIGINVNNLRANETYTFQVFADINLQDGNPIQEEAYIGSVFVQTKKPQKLVANFNAASSYSTAFSINFSLSNPETLDSSLEASTLSELTFTLYQGTNTSGAKEVFRRVVDANQDDYVSTLKQAFYDNSAIINPAFFDTKNADYTEKVYTLKISDAYDYTDYKNKIEIENDTFKFDINSYIPEVPDDPNKAIYPIEIQNKAAESFGLTYDPNLDPVTVVGYNLVTNYFNEANNAVRMIYHVYMYDHIKGQYIHLEHLDKSIYYDENGNVEPALYLLSNGTKDDTVDTDTLRRGNEYYFTYEVMLDIDNNKEEDTVYPNVVDDGVVLRCPNLSPKKQPASFLIYPSISDNTTATWKYKYTDIDNALYENKLYSYLEGTTYYSSSPNININDNYQGVTFTSLTPGKYYTISKQEKRLKNGKSEFSDLTAQYFYGYTANTNLKYTASIKDNRLLIAIDGYYDTPDIVDNQIASADVTITPVSSEDAEELGSTKLTNLVFDSGNIYINLYDIEKYLSIPISIDVDVYHDSGNTGFDVPSTYKAIQSADMTPTDYYSIEKSNEKLGNNSTVVGSEFSVEFNAAENLLKITDRYTKEFEFNIEIDSMGVYYKDRNVYLLAKELKIERLGVESQENKETKFDLIIPSISLMNSSNKTNILALLNTAEVSAKVSVAKDTDLKDGIIYVDLYKIDENGTNASRVRVLELTPDQINKKFTITGLTPKTDYYLIFRAMVFDKNAGEEGSGGAYKEYSLYDIDRRESNVMYRFHTLSDVGIGNIKANFETNTYNNKNIRFDYTLESIQGYDYIEYKIYEKVDEEFIPVDIDIPNSVAFFKNMTFSIPAPPGNEYGFAYGKTYRIDITPIGHYDDNGVNREINLGTKSQEFTLKDFEEPYIGISASKTFDTISFKVSIDDSTKVLKDDMYTVKLMTSNYEPIYTENGIDANTINKTFTFNSKDHGLVENSLYIFVVTLDLDYNNANADFTELTQTKSIRFGDSVNLGSVSASKNSENNYAIDIIFADSYKLNSINKISYTVSSTAVSYFSTGSGDFTIRYDANSNLYTYTMKVLESENFKSGIMYTITMNFYTDTELVAQEEISYYYGGGQ